MTPPERDASETRPTLFCGTAHWNVPAEFRDLFVADGSHLVRYASRFNAVEINSTFYRSHRPATYERWSDTVPEGFRFSVKVPKIITHEFRLREARGFLESFLEEVGHLGPKLRVLLVQLPPSAQYVPDVALEFFDTLRELTSLVVVCEPRHVSWFSDAAEDMLAEFEIGRVAADPVRAPGGDRPGAHCDVVYYRLHGSPRTYYSAYEDEFLEHVAERAVDDLAAGRETWCIFDNTALGAATGNALDLASRVARLRT